MPRLHPQVNGLYPWPYAGGWTSAESALVVVDMQRDFLDPAGWLALTGGDLEPLCQIVPAVGQAIAAARSAGIAVIYTVEAHRPDLLDLPANKLWRSRRLGHAIGDRGGLGRHLVAGEAGADVVAALAPNDHEPVVSKPGKSAFIGTDFDHILRGRDIGNLIFVGITMDGAVQASMRDANDRGYECLVLADATASDDAHDHLDQLHTLTLAGGHYGSIATVGHLVSALTRVPGAQVSA